MTTYRHPDYDIEINISPKIFRALRGRSSSVIVLTKVSGDKRGMLIIPEGQEDTADSKIVIGWLWIDDQPDLSIGDKVVLAIVEFCDEEIVVDELMIDLFL